MGVTCVVPVPVPDGKSSNQVVDLLQKKFDFLGANKVGSWSIDSETYQSAQSTDGNFKLISILHTSEHPTLTFSILEDDLCVVAENGFDSILSKLKAFYVPKKGGKTEVRGTKHEYGDFNLKIGSITQASNFKGILMEVEYRPCFDTRQCWDLLHEFMAALLGNDTPKCSPPASLVDEKLSLFSAADTVVQYNNLISSIKKQP